MPSRRHILMACAAFTVMGAPDARAQSVAKDAPYNWASVPFGAGGFIDGFVFHPREAGLLYARTDVGGVYRYDPAKQRWVPLLDHLSKADADLMGVLSLAVDPNDPDRLYAACGLYLGAWARKGAVLSSADRGRTWRICELGVNLAGNGGGRGAGERLQVDPNKGSILLLGTSDDGLMRSDDSAASFRKVDFPARHVSLVLFDPKSGTAGQGSRTLYVGAHGDNAGLYVSTDSGQSFTRETGAPKLMPQRAAFGPDGSLYVTFAGGEGDWPPNPGNAKTGGVWKRDPSGKWHEISPMIPGGINPSFGYSGLDVDARRPGRLIVSTIERWGTGDDIYLSVDDGKSWTALGKHSRHDINAFPWLRSYTRGEDRMGHWIADVKFDPHDPQVAIYGTGYGLWITRNLGAAETGDTVAWSFEVANLEETAVLELKSPSGGATLLAAIGDVSGGAWDDLSKSPDAGVFRPASETSRSVDFAELNPAVMARVSDQATTSGYWSGDGGASWTPFATSPRKSKGSNGAYLTCGRIAVSAKGASFVWAPEKQAGFYSLDKGKTWKESAGWPSSRDVALVPIADRALDGVFYVLDRAASQILISVDHGASFKPVIKGLPRIEGWQTAHLISASGTPRDLWLVLPEYLMHFPGPDKPGRLIKPVGEAWNMALGKAAPGADYHSLYVWGKVKGAEGLFRSDDAGGSFVRINDDTHRFGALTAMAADPLEFGTLYIAPHGRGVIVGRPAS